MFVGDSHGNFPDIRIIEVSPETSETSPELYSQLYRIKRWSLERVWESVLVVQTSEAMVKPPK